jgi:hypothetical protein
MGGMRKSQWREFQCSVVNELVLIRLKRSGSFDRRAPYYVQCNQTECQYVEKNELPCPLHIGMFPDDLREIEDRRRAAAAE